jgi:hypothetical protein
MTEHTTTNRGEPVLIELDGRRRCSLGKVGHPEHTRYLVDVQRDGTMILTPAVVLPVTDATATISGDGSLQGHMPYNGTTRPEGVQCRCMFIDRPHTRAAHK